MPKRPKSVEKATEEEILHLRERGARNYMWEFPEEVFNGEWWKIEVPENQVSSAGNSFRNQCHSVYHRRANVHNKNGYIWVRLLEDKPVDEKPKQKAKK